MTTPSSNPNCKPTLELIAEASAWLAILHGPNRTAETERGFRQWLGRSPVHARAFEEATEVWEDARNLPRPRTYRTSLVAPPVRLLFALAASVAVLAIGAVLYLRNSGITTDIGEQRILTLDDGSRVTLNTNTSVVVKYDRALRRIELESGEALFEVSKRLDWPFIVTTGDHTVRALGTTFAVRRDSREATVTLIEGKVLVTSAGDGARAASQTSELGPSRADETAAGGAGVTLAPGQRLTFADESAPRIDAPPLEKVLAWRNREVAFDNAALSDAMAEMNRYNRRRLVTESAQTDSIRVTGLFRAGDSMSFARAVAEAYGLQVIEGDREIRVTGAPAQVPPHP